MLIIIGIHFRKVSFQSTHALEGLKDMQAERKKDLVQLAGKQKKTSHGSNDLRCLLF